jgi:hypothetical protein
MAKEQKPKTGWLERRRERKRYKRERKARRVLDQRKAGAPHGEKYTPGGF